MTDPTYPTLAERIREAGIVLPVRVEEDEPWWIVMGDNDRYVCPAATLAGAQAIAAALNAAGAPVAVPEPVIKAVGRISNEEGIGPLPQRFIDRISLAATIAAGVALRKADEEAAIDAAEASEVREIAAAMSNSGLAQSMAEIDDDDMPGARG